VKAFVESYKDGKQIVKICGDDDEVIDRFEVSAVIVENNLPICLRECQGVQIRLIATRN